MSRIPGFVTRALAGASTSASNEPADETLHKLASTSRRAFLGGGLAVASASVPAALMVGSSKAQGATSSSSVIKTAINKAYFQEIQRNEASHVQIILAAIRSLGGTPRPYPTFRGISTNNPVTLLANATLFENTGVSAYFGASPYLFNPAVKAVASSLAFVEAYQGGFLNTLSDLPLVPGGSTYAMPATIAEVLAAVDPFIVSLNDNGEFPPTFSMTPSPQNDIAILNFALILEYLEATFYFESVSQVFGA